jgi:ketosteroid isomerase-like protein
VGNAGGSRECAPGGVPTIMPRLKMAGTAQARLLPTLRRKSIEMPHNKSDIIRALFAAYMSNDRASVENSFSDDFRFSSPYDDRIDKATYFERCWRNSDWIERQQLEKIFVEGEEAFVSYEVETKDGKSFRNTEFFRFNGGRIKRIDVYFGATYQDGAFVKQQG